MLAAYYIITQIISRDNYGTAQLTIKFCTAQDTDLKSSRCCILPSGPESADALG